MTQFKVKPLQLLLALPFFQHWVQVFHDSVFYNLLDSNFKAKCSDRTRKLTKLNLLMRSLELKLFNSFEVPFLPHWGFFFFFKSNFEKISGSFLKLQLYNPFRCQSQKQWTALSNWAFAAFWTPRPPHFAGLIILFNSIFLNILPEWCGFL